MAILKIMILFVYTLVLNWIELFGHWENNAFFFGAIAKATETVYLR